jgi:hypothetical protein
MQRVTPSLSKGSCIVVLSLALTCVPAAAASTPKPSGAPAKAAIRLPDKPLHAEYLVEVNAKGQVVRVKSGKGSDNAAFNFETYGNAQQMWIRRPDGTAQVGLFKVTYDYDPKTHDIARHVSIVSKGGDWANEEGAANRMIDTAKEEAKEFFKQREEESKKLPSLDQIIGASPSPSPSPHR